MRLWHTVHVWMYIHECVSLLKLGQNKTMFTSGRLMPDSWLFDWEYDPPPSACCSDAAAGAVEELAVNLRIYRSQGMSQRNFPSMPLAAKSLLISSHSQPTAKTDGKCIHFFKSHIWRRWKRPRWWYYFSAGGLRGELDRRVCHERGVCKVWLWRYGGLTNWNQVWHNTSRCSNLDLTVWRHERAGWLGWNALNMVAEQAGSKEGPVLWIDTPVIDMEFIRGLLSLTCLW